MTRSITLFSLIVLCTLNITGVLAAPRIHYPSSAVPVEGERREVLITGYDDNSSQTGVKYSAYPLKMKLPSNDNTKALGIAGDEVTVYPGAVHGRHYGDYMYGIIRVWVKETDELIYVHIVDRCDPSDSVCNTNIEPYGFLVDIQKVGWAAAGRSGGDLYSYGKISYVTKLSSDLMIEYYDRKNDLSDWMNCVCDKADCNPDKLSGGPYWCPRGRCYLKSEC